MARRRRPPAEPVPERLARFVESEWSGEADPVRAWKAAALAWLAADPARRLPFGTFGGPIDVLRETRRLLLARLPGDDERSR